MSSTGSPAVPAVVRLPTCRASADARCSRSRSALSRPGSPGHRRRLAAGPAALRHRQGDQRAGHDVRRHRAAGRRAATRPTRPPATGPRARSRCVMVQTPYGKNTTGAASGSEGAREAGTQGGPLPYFVKRGYINVVAEIRGTGASHGVVRPAPPDPGQGRRRAGALGVEAAATPTARSGLYGPSYMGLIQYMTAARARTGVAAEGAVPDRGRQRPPTATSSSWAGSPTRSSTSPWCSRSSGRSTS